MKATTATAGMNQDKEENTVDERSFLQRYRLPLFLAVVALCLYVGSIAYILLGRGQV